MIDALLLVGLIVVIALGQILMVTAILRQRTTRNEIAHSVDHDDIQEPGDDPDVIPLPMEYILDRPDQRHGGKFLGFLILLVAFFTILSAIASSNFFAALSPSTHYNNHEGNLHSFSHTSLSSLKFLQISNSCSWQEDTNKSQNLHLVANYRGNIQDYNMNITTSSPLSQELFLHGLFHLFGFNKKEALRHFEAAVQEDPYCAMCHLGIAASTSPNLNDESMTDDGYKLGHDSTLMALSLLQPNESPCDKEMLLIQAMLERFQLSPHNWRLSSKEIRSELEFEYSRSLGVAYSACPFDADIASLYSESLLVLSPWSYFLPQDNSHSPSSSFSSTIDRLSPNPLKAFHILHHLLFENPPVLTISTDKLFAPMNSRHPLALHLYLHISEQFYSPNPSNSTHLLIAADTLLFQSLSSSTSSSSLPIPIPRKNLKPSFNSVLARSVVGHLLHMPSHAYYRTGLYDMCLLSSQLAVSSDRFAQENCFTPYLPTHNIAMLVVCAIENGQLDVALSSTIFHNSIEISTTQATKFMTSMVPWPQDIIYTRFGNWSSVIHLHNISTFPSIEEYPAYSLSLYLYTDCIAKISLSYSQYPDVVSSLLVFSPRSHLKMLKAATRAIPHDNKPPSHHFYQYHQEIGSIIWKITSACADLFHARYALHSWRTSLDFDNLSSLHSSTLHRALNYFNTTKTALQDALFTQQSFHYMEPEGFYLSVSDCYLPLLQEIWMVHFHYKELQSLSPENNQNNQDFLTLLESDERSLQDLEQLYLSIKQQRFPVGGNIWHERSYQKYREFVRRYESYLGERKRSEFNDLPMKSQAKFMIDWFENEQRMLWRFRGEDLVVVADRPLRGSCCELLYC